MIYWLHISYHILIVYIVLYIDCIYHTIYSLYIHTIYWLYISYYILFVYIILYSDCTSTISWVLGLNLDDSLMGGLCRALTDLTTQRLILDCWTISTIWTDGGDLFWIPDLLQCLSDGSVGASAVNIRSCWRSSTTMLSSSWWKARETRPPGMIST